MTQIYHLTNKGLVVELRITPKSVKDQVAGIYVAPDGVLSLKLKVRAQPEKGRANQAVISLMSKILGVPKSCLEIINGATDRRKSLLVRAEAAQVIEKLNIFQEEADNERASNRWKSLCRKSTDTNCICSKCAKTEI